MKTRFLSIAVVLILFSLTATANADFLLDEQCRRASENQMLDIDASAVNKAGLPTVARAGVAIDPQDAIRKSKNIYLIYNFRGAICFQSQRRVKEGDILYVAVYAKQSEVENLDRLILYCEAESSDLQLLDTLNKGDFVEEPTDGAEAVRLDPHGFYWYSAQECFGTVVRFELRDSNNELKFGKSIQQYQRFEGTFQVGAVWTTLSDREFSRVTINGVETIQSNTSSGRGPLYLGSLVVYGLPHYITAIGDSSRRYAGRDIVNETDWMDSVGLVLSLGLEDPTDTFGVGVSWEFARGVSLTYSHLSRRVQTLNGVSIGDSYPTALGDIPTQRGWENEAVWGLSIDGRYLTKFFTNN